jgi:hypothetical protein
MFYDGPQRPEGIFDAFFEFLEIPVIETSASFFEFLKVLPSSDPFAGKRSVVPHLPAHLPWENLILRSVEHTSAASLSWGTLHRFLTCWSMKLS